MSVKRDALKGGLDLRCYRVLPKDANNDRRIFALKTFLRPFHKLGKVKEIGSFDLVDHARGYPLPLEGPGCRPAKSTAGRLPGWFCLFSCAD